MKAAIAGNHQVSATPLCLICTFAFNPNTILEGSEKSFYVSTGMGHGVPRLNIISWCVHEGVSRWDYSQSPQTGSNPAAQRHYPHFIKTGTEVHKAQRPERVGPGSPLYKAEPKWGTQAFSGHVHCSAYHPSDKSPSQSSLLLYPTISVSLEHCVLAPELPSVLVALCKTLIKAVLNWSQLTLPKIRFSPALAIHSSISVPWPVLYKKVSSLMSNLYPDD